MRDPQELSRGQGAKPEAPAETENKTLEFEPAAARKTADSRLASGKPYLDLLKHGDIAVLTICQQSVIFVAGVPRALFDTTTRVLRISRAIYRLVDADWHLWAIEQAIPDWSRRVLCNQSACDHILRKGFNDKFQHKANRTDDREVPTVPRRA